MGLNRQEDLMELLADQQEEALQLMRAREARERYAAEAPARAAAAAAEEARQAEQHTANVNAGKHLDVCTVLVAGTVGDTFSGIGGNPGPLGPGGIAVRAGRPDHVGRFWFSM